MSRPRGISKDFRAAFKSGLLSQVLERVKRDHTLDLQIREEEVHVYYRGGKLLGLTPASSSMEAFNCSFDRNYLGSDQTPPGVEDLPVLASSVPDIEAWLRCFPHLKERMDFFYTAKAEKNEREFQQVITRENNYANVSNETDYFIVDSEYVHPSFPTGQIDLVAFKWKSESSVRQKGQVGLSLIEVKYGDKALKGGSGLVEHVKRMTSLTRDANALNVTKGEMLSVFNQKRELGLVRFGSKGNRNEVNSFTSDAPEVMLLLVNHDPASSALLAELRRLDEADRNLLKIAVSNFFGYGLYEECVFGFDEFLSRYARQLNSRA